MVNLHKNKQKTWRYPKLTFKRVFDIQANIQIQLLKYIKKNKEKNIKEEKSFHAGKQKKKKSHQMKKKNVELKNKT